MEAPGFHLPDYHRLRSTIPDRSATPTLSHSTPDQRIGYRHSHNPTHATPAGYHTRMV
jgi:hypothetical protein